LTLACATAGAYNATISNANLVGKPVVAQASAPSIYPPNANFVTYGSVSDTFLPATNNNNFCSSNVPLNFTYKYFNVLYTTVSVCVQPNISLSSSASISALYEPVQPVTTTSWGTVSYRIISDLATLKNLSQTALLSYSYTGVFSFTATNGFVATWNHVPFAADQNKEVNAQIILLTDGFFSFVLIKYGSINGYQSSAYSTGTSASTLYNTFYGDMSTTNVGLAGTYAIAVNNISIKHFLSY
jgi:hypothetical protein